MSNIKLISQAEKQIIDELNEKIDYLQSFFDFFLLNSTNFSKSLQNEINLFAPLIKRNEEVFTASFKDKLIFTGENSSSYNSFDEKKLDMLIKVLSKINLELKYNKEKNEKRIQAEEINYNKEKMHNIMEEVSKAFETNEKKYMTQEKTDNDDNITVNTVNELIEQIESLKKEIEEIHKENEELDKEKKDYEDKLKNFCNLATDMNQIKKMIEVKKAEFELLLKTKK